MGKLHMQTKASASFALAVLLALATFSAQTAAQTQTPTQPNSHVRYKLIDLGTLGGTAGWPYSLNNRGQVTGQSNLAGDANFHAFLWQQGVLTDLGTLPGDTVSYPISINNTGQIAGQGSRAILWDSGGNLIDLNALVPDAGDVPLAPGKTAAGTPSIRKVPSARMSRVCAVSPECCHTPTSWSASGAGAAHPARMKTQVTTARIDAITLLISGLLGTWFT